MKPSFYSGASGLMAHQQRLNSIGNDIANVNTVGYKDQVVSFDDLLYRRMYANTETDPSTGIGVKAVDAGINFAQGSFRNTGLDTDFAVAGDGLFAIEMGGQRLYTRDGEFIIRMEGENGYLSTQDGAYVLNKEGQRIALEKLDGKNKFDLTTLNEEIGVYRVSNPYALEPIGNNKFAATELSGQAQVVTDNSYELLNKYIENSSVNLTDKMADMIAAQRAYQVSARVLQVSDENEQTINSLRR